VGLGVTVVKHKCSIEKLI